MEKSTLAIAVVGGWLAYEALRAGIAASVRRQTPVILRRELATRSPAAGILGPVLGTDAVSEVIGAIAQQSILDTLPTVIGPRAYTPVFPRRTP